MLMKIMFCVILSFKKYIYIYIFFFQVFIPSGQSSKRRTLDRAESDSNNTESPVTFTDQLLNIIVSKNFCLVISPARYLLHVVFLSLSVLSTYMVWRSIKDVVPLLSKEFRAVHQKFKVKLLGSKRNKTRADICFSYTNNILGPMLGALFIRSAFGPSSKEKVGNSPTSYPVPLVLFAPGPLSFWLREIWERD